MTVKDLVRLRLAGGPDRDMSVRSRCYNASVLEIGDGIHRAIMKAKNLLGSIAGQRPADRRCVEASRDRMGPVGRDGQGLHRTAVTAQLSMRRGEGDQTQEHADREMLRPKSHNDPIQSIGLSLEHFEACSAISASLSGLSQQRCG